MFLWKLRVLGLPFFALFPLSHYCYMLRVGSGNEYANNIKIHIYFYDFIPIVCGGMSRHPKKGFKCRRRRRCTLRSFCLAFDVRNSDPCFLFQTMVLLLCFAVALSTQEWNVHKKEVCFLTHIMHSISMSHTREWMEACLFALYNRSI